jgi:hypothetical protein
MAIVARAKSYKITNGKLKVMMEKPRGALDWSQRHNTKFELDKTALICLSRKHTTSTVDPQKTIPVHQPSITISEHTIQLLTSHKFLGIIIDQELRFKEQVASTLAKGTKYTLACSQMIRTTKGIKG